MSGKVVTAKGKLLGLVRSGGEWVAVVQSFGTTATFDPVIARLCPIEVLNGPARRKASRWLDVLDRLEHGARDAA